MQIKPGLFLGITAAAFVSLAAAAAVSVTGDRWVSGEVRGERAFPVLQSRINDVASVQITQGGDTLKIARGDDAWTAAAPYGGYEVEADRVASLLVRLSQAELIEPKTRNPDKYELLDLGDPGKKDSEARLIVLRDAKGDVITEVVLGSKRWDAFGSGKSGSYIRRPGEPRTWLTNLDVNPTPAIKAWVETNIFGIETGKISSVTVTAEGEAPLTINRLPGDKTKFELAGLPSDAKRKESAPKPDDVAEAYASVELEDLRKLEMTPAGPDVMVSELKADNGLKVTFRLRKEGDQDWLSLSAEGEGEAAKQAKEINARVKGWEYKIPSWKADGLFRTRSDFLETS